MNYDEFGGLARALFEGAGEAQLLCDPESGQILDANAAAQRLCGYSLRELLGTRFAGRPAAAFGRDLGRWRELVHPEDQSRWDRAWERRRAGVATDEQYRVVWPDGSARWVRDCARVVREDGRACWLFGAFVDTTARH